MKQYLKAFLAVVIFFCMQMLGGAVAIGYLFVTNAEYRTLMLSGNASAEMQAKYLDSDMLALTVILSGIFTVICVYLLKMLNRKTMFKAGAIEWKWAGVAMIAALFGIFASDLVSELIDLPNNMEEQFMEMSSSVIGVLAVALIGPIVEEIVFREAVCGSMMRNGVKTPIAVVVSALCFGLIHANPAQIPFAFVIGLIFGVIYAKTGNIVVTSIIHVINNSFAVVQMNELGEDAKDFSMLEQCGSMGIPYIIMLAIGCVVLLREFWLRYVPKEGNAAQTL